MDYKFLDKKHALAKQRNRQLLLRAFSLIVFCMLGLLLSNKIFRTNYTQHASTETNLPIVHIPNELDDGESNLALKPMNQPIIEPTEFWETVRVEKGDSLAAILAKYKISRAEIQHLLDNKNVKKNLTKLMPGESLKLKYNKQHEILELIYQPSPNKNISFTRNGDRFEMASEQKQLEMHLVRASGTVKQSLYEASKKANIPDKVTMQLAQIFAWQINFAKDLRPGDTFSVLYEEFSADGKPIAAGNIIAADFSNQKIHYQGIRFTTEDEFTRYYNQDGDSLQKAFIRTPVKYKRISSPFNPKRKHPVLNITRPHWGVDLAAPSGTPVKASGDGKVIFAGKNGGYGNLVELSHGQNITTRYAHLKKFAKGIKPGVKVHKGQTIAYVGSTGLADGPHLHYEYRIKGQPQNPMKVNLPKGNKIPQTQLAEFHSISGPLLARLEGNETIQLAESTTETTQG